MPKMFRCYACVNEKGLPGRDFEADKKLCPYCGLDGTNPGTRFAQMFAELATVHFDPPTGVPGVGKNHAACDPKARVGGPQAPKATGEPLAVSCKACKRTPEFATAMAERGEPHTPPEADLLVTIDPAKLSYTPTPAGG